MAYIYDTTNQAEGAIPNGTRVLHQKKDRPGIVTGSQITKGGLVYNVAWEDRRALPIFVPAEKLKPAP